MKKLFEIIKSLFKRREKKVVNEETKSPLSSVNIGDIIWAKRYYSEKQESQMADNHKEGPHVVLVKTDKWLICSYGTGVKRDDDRFLAFNVNEYGFTKNTYFKLYGLRTIDEKNYIRTIGKLEKRDVDLFYREIKDVIKSYKYQNHRFSFDLPIQSGDIIESLDKLYLVMDVISDKISCIELDKEKLLDTNVDYDYFKGLNYEKLVCLDYDYNNITYINSLPVNTFLSILKKQKEKLEYSKRKNIVQRGSVVEYNNKILYIYGEEGKNYLMYEMSNDNLGNYDSVIINAKKYYTNYEPIVVSKLEDFVIIDLATLKEIDNIKNKKKLYKEKVRIEQDILKNEEAYNDAITNKEFSFGDIVKIGEGPNYIVIKCSGDDVYSVSEYSIEEIFPKIHTFKKEDVILVGYRDKIDRLRDNLNFVVDTVKVKQKKM